MSRPRLAWLSAGVVVLGAVSCFKDPTDSLRSGASRLQLSRSLATMSVAETLVVTVQVRDDQGNFEAFGVPTFASTDPTIATLSAYPDSAAGTVPGNTLWRANLVAHAAGQATLTVTAGGVSDTIGVVSIPRAFIGTAIISGTAGTDTVVVNQPPPAAPLVVAYTAGDTLTLTAPSGVTFNAGAGVNFGLNSAYILSKTATVIKAMARAGFAGRPVITSLTFDPGGGRPLVTLATLQTADSINIEHARFRGTAVVTADPNFGAATLLTVTAPANAAFGATSAMLMGGVPAVGLAASVAPAATIRLTQTAGSMTAISAANATGAILVTNVVIGTATIDSLRANTNLAAGGALTINKSSFPGTVASSGTFRLLDTLVISGGAATFTTAAATASTVTIGVANGVAQQAFIVSRTATTIRAISKVANAGPITITNVIISGTTIPSLQTSGNVAVSATTGEPSEPGNNAFGGARALGTFAGAADTIQVFASLDCEDDGTACPGNGDFTDWFSFTTSATANLRVIVDWFGNGTGGQGATGYGTQPQNPDLDVAVCTAASCSGATLVASSAGLTNPETASTTTSKPAGTYFINVSGWVMPGPIAYRIRILRF